MVYQKVKEIAEQKGISIKALEVLAGLSNGAIGKWENVSPRVENLQKVADALDVPITALIGEEEQIQQTQEGTA